MRYQYDITLFRVGLDAIGIHGTCQKREAENAADNAGWAQGSKTPRSRSTGNK
jgi:hypothetical protein